MKSVFLTLACLHLLFPAKAVTVKPTSNRPTPDGEVLYEEDRLSLGIGFGYEFAGIGSNAIVYPHASFGLTGGIGYVSGELTSFGGLKIRKITDGSWNIAPYFVALYGFSGGVVAEGNDELSRNFQGVSLGLGLDQKWKPRKKGYFSLSVLYPIRGAEYNDHLDRLENSGYDLGLRVIPVRISLGFHWVLK